MSRFLSTSHGPVFPFSLDYLDTPSNFALLFFTCTSSAFAHSSHRDCRLCTNAVCENPKEVIVELWNQDATILQPLLPLLRATPLFIGQITFEQRRRKRTKN
jgi:hypothetical protein